jgi:putative transposase
MVVVSRLRSDERTRSYMAHRTADGLSKLEVIRGVQYLSIRYTERLAETGAVCSVGSRGDSYDNALAEAVNGLYKTEVIGKSGPWPSLEQMELATAEWVDWWNNRRLHGAIGDVPPSEFEADYHRRHAAAEAA